MRNHRSVTYSVLRLIILGLIAFCSMKFGLMAQPNPDFIIEGQVHSGSVPLPGIEVQVYTRDRAYDQTQRTDFQGKFRTQFDLDPADSAFFWIQLVDPCTSTAIAPARRATVNPTFVKIEICSSREVPCSAEFEVAQAPQFSVQFFTTDFFDVFKHLWDFGDGQQSTETNPIHTYADSGDYNVIHTLQGEDNCQDTATMTIPVKGVSCACPEYYLPVCVTDSSGTLLQFDNPCFAFCAGYFQFESCQDSCTTCPDTIAPVCVGSPSGEITFKNACEAECSGFTEYSSCEVECDCDDVFAPVCGILDDGTFVRFENECVAKCEGYENLEPCDSCFCPDYFDAIDVCVILESGEMITFSNPCEAECAGYAEYYLCDPDCDCPFDFEPVCLLGPADGVEFFLNQCFADCQGQEEWIPCDTCNCPFIFSPVCGLDSSGVSYWFANECLAQCAGFDTFSECEDECFCPAIYDPVCVRTEDTLLTFSNSCQAECQGFQEWFSCVDTCGCPEIYEPVCVVANGKEIRFENRCQAECAGYTDYEACDDPCICPEIYEPVCAVNEDGDTIEFSNRCFAKCEGYGPDEIFRCKVTDDCVCISLYDPVCVVNEVGDTIEFSNRCFARCEGYGSDQIFRCNPSDDCGCDAIYDPVCVLTAHGVEEFSSACLAICAGYDVFFNCDRACDCPEEGEPVCIALPLGLQIELPNSCWAECLGLTAEPCDQDETVGAVGEIQFTEAVSNQRRLDVLLAFPNPFHDLLTISLDQGDPPAHRVEVFDLLGRSVHQRDLSTQLSLTEIELDGRNWHNGIYLVQISFAGGNKVLRVVKE